MYDYEWYDSVKEALDFVSENRFEIVSLTFDSSMGKYLLVFEG